MRRSPPLLALTAPLLLLLLSLSSPSCARAEERFSSAPVCATAASRFCCADKQLDAPVVRLSVSRYASGADTFTCTSNYVCVLPFVACPSLSQPQPSSSAPAPAPSTPPQPACSTPSAPRFCCGNLVFSRPVFRTQPNGANFYVADSSGNNRLFTCSRDYTCVGLGDLCPGQPGRAAEAPSEAPAPAPEAPGKKKKKYKGEGGALPPSEVTSEEAAPPTAEPPRGPPLCAADQKFCCPGHKTALPVYLTPIGYQRVFKNGSTELFDCADRYQCVAKDDKCTA